jgi:hypothetical protein
MGIGKILEQYKTQFPDDQATFNRWIRANAVIGSIIAIGLIAMAVAGSRSGPSSKEVEVAGVEKAAPYPPVGTARLRK